MYDNLFAWDWKVDGLEAKVSPDAMIEVIDLEESEESENPSSLNG